MSQHLKDGSQNLSVGAPKSRKNSKSKKSALKVQTISSYFKNQPVQKEKSPKSVKSLINMEEDHVEETNFKLANSDSPYNIFRNPDTKISLNVSDNEGKDFKSPVLPRNTNNSKFKLGPAPIQKRKMCVKKVQNKKCTSKKKASNISTIQIIKDNFKYSDENPEHLQMALALSRSTYEAEFGSNSQSPSKDETPNISEIFRSSKPTFLERFGFKSCNSKISVENKRGTTVSLEGTKPARNRFKYITPILNIRSKEERNSLIDSKITLILSQENQASKKHFEYSVNSKMLDKFISKDRFIFDLNDVYERNLFYVKSLEISQSTYKCGVLLKDWDSIPGREKSPCKTLEYITNKERPLCYQVENNRLSPLKNCTASMETPKKVTSDTTFSEVTSETNLVSKEKSPSKKMPGNHLNETFSLEARYSFSSSNKIKKTLISLDSDSKDSAVTTSFVSSATSTFHSFSSCRSMSPELFDSDEEKNNEVLEITKHKVTNNSLSPKNIRERVSQPFSIKENIQNNGISPKCTTEKLEDCLERRKIKISNDYSCLQDCNVKNVSTNEIIDLTDDDNDANISKETNMGCKTEIINTDCISPPTTSTIYKSADKCTADIYNLDDFEEDSSDKITLSPYDNEHFKNTTKGENVQNLNIQTMQCENSDSANDNFSSEDCHVKNSSGIGNLFEGCVTEDNNCSFTHINDINNDTVDPHFVNQANSKASNKSQVSKNAVIENLNEKTKNETSSESPYNHLDIFCDKDVIQKRNSRLEDTPTRSCSIKSLFYDNPKDTCDISPKFVQKQRLDVNNSNYLNLSLQETPKKGSENKTIKSPYFDEQNLYDSADLNVTDYINNMLSQEHYSYNNAETTNVGEDNEESLEQCSQGSIALDEEINYSSHFATPLRVKDKAGNEETYSDQEQIDDLENVLPQSPGMQEQMYVEEPLPKLVSFQTLETSSKITHNKKMSTPDSLIIKLKNVTPMPDYDKMTTPLIKKELQKVGVKPLKRTRGAKLLKYIYESTHPLVGPSESFVSDNPDPDENTRIIKRRKKSNDNVSILTSKYSNSTHSSVCDLGKEKLINIVGDGVIENEKLEDLIFERKQSVKIPSCKVPLQIVWHNFIVSHPSIKENILLYEPLQLESIHMMLKEEGFKFHIQDLLTFLDKKCITIRTAQKQGKIHR